jgi:hypothetical protein
VREHFAIVRRDKPEVYERLQQRFPDGSGVQVIWDRRFRERRQTLSFPERERRIRERRQIPPSSWTLGYVIAYGTTPSRE